MEEAKVGKILLMLIIENVHHSLWVSVTRRILWVPQTLQNKTLGVHWGILGLFFSLTLLLATGMKMRIVFHCDNPCQFWRTRSVNVQPSHFSQTSPLNPSVLTQGSGKGESFGPAGCYSQSKRKPFACWGSAVFPSARLFKIDWK